jgi:7-cyano-7-deazaguanine synthase in queuosine biosynthesis
MQRDTILAMFSGGIDSTGVLHQLFTNPEFNSRPLIIHHIFLQNRENRAKAEAQAVESILKYYSDQFPAREYTYTNCVFNTTGFAPLNSNRYPYDMDVCAFVASNICVARKDIKQVAMGRTLTDIQGGGENFQIRMSKAQKVFASIFSLEKEDAPEYIFPVKHMLKKTIWNSLPKQVKDAAWYCRKPKYTESGSAETCQQCITCKEVVDFIQHQEVS